MDSIHEHLFSHPGFREGRHWYRRGFAANETVIAEGEHGRELFLVRQGIVRVTGSAHLEQGGAIHPGFCDLGPGELFGETGLLPRLARTATVTAVTDCELAVIDGEALLEFFDRHPETGYRLMLALYEQAASRLDQTNRQLLKILSWGLRAHRIEAYLDAGLGMAASGETRPATKTAV